MTDYAKYSSQGSGVSIVANGGSQRKGMHLTTPKIAAIVIVFVVSVVAVGLIVHFTKPPCEECEKFTPPPTQPPATVTQQPPMTTAPPRDTDYRLPTIVKPVHYSLVLAPYLYDNNSDAFYFTGQVIIELNVSSQTNTFKLHRHASLNITNMTITHNGTELQFTEVYEPVKEWHVITLDGGTQMEPGQKYFINVYRFRAPLTGDLKGLYLSQFTKGNETKYLATSQLQPTDARKTFPCFDEPTFKATFDVSIVRRSDFVAISNMDTKRNTSVEAADWYDEGDLAGDWVLEEYDTTPIMSSYLLAFIVSEFDHVDEMDAKNRLYRNWMRPEFKNISAYAMKAVKNITNFFEDYYQVPYPLTKTDQAAVPDFNAGAMENWGLIIYRETRLLYDAARDTASILQAIGNVISHELAHMWYGNLVTADWWDDIWLNEGFASFTQGLGVDQLHPEWEIDAQFIPGQQASAFDVDARASSRPIYNAEVYSPSDIGAMFDTITYRKGASVLRQMYYFLGETTFKEGIGKYLNGSAYSNAKHGQLFDVLNAQAKANNQTVNVTAVMQTWILQMGFPVVTIEREGDRLRMRQQHFLSDPTQQVKPSPFTYIWHIPITLATDATVAGWTRANVNEKISQELTWMTGRQQEIALPSNGSNWYIANLWAAGFYRVNYDAANWRAIAGQLMTNHTVFSPQDRAKFIEDSFTLAAAGNISYEVPMNLTRYLAKENHYVPWRSAISQLSYIHRMLHRSSPEYGPFSAYMRKLLQPAFNKIDFNQDKTGIHLEDLKRSLIVGASCLYGVRECEMKAQVKFAEFERNNYTTLIPPDIRSRVLCEGVATSFVVQWDQLFSYMQKESHPGIQNDVLRSLGCTTEPWILNRFLSYALDDSKIRLQDASTVFSSVAANPSGLQIVWDYLQANWKSIDENFPGSFTTSYFVNNLGSFNTEPKRREMIAFRDANRELLGSASRAMQLAIDTVEANIKWMNANLADLSQWLINFGEI